jgi:hypothetical protein
VIGNLYQLVAPTSTNAIICTSGKIPCTNGKSGLEQMSDSVVVFVDKRVK